MRKKTIALIALSFVLVSCGYQVQDYLPSNVTAVYVPLFQNNTDRYGLEERLTEEVIKKFLVDGSLKVEKKTKSQAMLEGRITRYMLIPLVYDVNNLVEEYKMVLTVNLRLIDMTTREVLWEEPEGDAVEIFYTAYSEEAQARNSAELEPDVMERLLLRMAEKVVERVVRGWWVEEQF